MGIGDWGLKIENRGLGKINKKQKKKTKHKKPQNKKKFTKKKNKE